MKDLKNGNGSQDALILAETGLTSAISPTSSITDPSSIPQLATLANLRAFTNANSLMTNNNTLDSTNLDAQAALASLHNNRQYAGLFPNAADNSMTNDQFLKAAKLLVGLNATPPANPTPVTSTGSSSSVERPTFRNDDLDLNEISEFIDQLSIVNCLNNDEKIINAAICILFNGIPLTLINPGSVAEEIYSSELFQIYD